MPTPNPLSILQTLPLLSTLELDELQRIHGASQLLNARKGSVVIREGEYSQGLYIIIRGQASRELRLTENADEPLTLLQSGDVMGELSIVDGDVASATVTMTSDGVLYRVGRQQFAALRADSDAAAFKVLRAIAPILCRRLRILNQRLGQTFSTQSSSHAGLQSITEHGALFENTSSTRRRLLAASSAGANMTEREVEAIAPYFTLDTFAPTEALCREGDAAFTFFIIVDGAADVLKAVPSERTQESLGRLNAGAMIGEVSLIDGEPRSASVIAHSVVHALCCSRTDFNRLFRAGDTAAYKLMDQVIQQLAARLRNANTQLHQLKTRPALTETM